MNQESNLFNPLDLDMSRSTFHYSPTYTGSCTAGTLIPTLAFEVLPGDSVKMDLNALIKMATPMYPTMDNLYLDVAFYFVRNDLVLGRRYGNPTVNDAYTSWKGIIGAQDNLINMPIPANGVRLPWVEMPYDILYGSLPDYFGVPRKIGSLANSSDVFGNATTRVNCLPFLSYFAVWNENYRDPNVDEPVTWSFDSSGRLNPQGHVATCFPTPIAQAVKATTLSGNYYVVNSLGATNAASAAIPQAHKWMPFHTCRFHGYLGSALPWPQRNTDGVELPLGDMAPVIAGDPHIESGDEDNVALIMQELNTSGEAVGHIPAGYPLASTSGTTGSIGVNNAAGTPTSGITVTPSNLWADLSQATAANVNMLRAAIQKQRWYEKLSRSGNRLDEMRYSLFAVRSADSLLDKPLFLGGKRIPLRMDMVASTNGASAGDIGKLGAFSHTNDSGRYFHHSFDDWGSLLCVFTIRAHTTHSNALSRSMVRQTREDFYFPTFAHLGEQQVSLPETGVNSAGVFGYQQAWEEYRTGDLDMVTGPLKPGKSLSYMTFAEDFNTLFGSSMTLADYLNASYQVQAIDQTLVTKSHSSSQGFQFLYQFNFDIKARRCLPTYSYPGLMDHF